MERSPVSGCLQTSRFLKQPPGCLLKKGFFFEDKSKCIDTFKQKTLENKHKNKYKKAKKPIEKGERKELYT